MKIPTTGPVPVALECRYCTAPIDTGVTCTFCKSYTPPDGVFQRSHNEAIRALTGATKTAQIAGEDIDDLLQVLPDSTPPMTVVDVVSARAHVLAARRLLDRAATAIGGAA